jgi:hypothetical protein
VSDWTINGKTLAALGVVGAVLTRGSWAEHSCELSLDGRSATVPGLWTPGDAVEIKYGSTVRFVGEVMDVGKTASGGAEGHRARLVNAWIVLAETIYEQSWTLTNGGSTANKARCIVGLKSNGEIGTLAEAITDVLNFAGVAVGSIVLASVEEPWEVRNVTCAEVIKQIARLAPRAVSWWTYPGGVATFNVASSPSAVELAMTAKTNVDLRPNRTQAVRGVRLQYEIVRTTSDVPQTDVVVDSAGATTGRRVLIQTIPWRGASANFLRQRVKVRTIPTTATGTDAAQKATRQFWAERCPELRAAKSVVGDGDFTPKLTFNLFDNAAAIWPEGLPDGTVGFGAASGGKYYFAAKLARIDGTDGTGAYELTDPDDAGSVKIRLDSGLTRMLVEGTVTPWMQRQGKDAQRWQLFANVSFIDAASGRPVQQVVHINVTVTDCVTKEYVELQSYADGDAVPTGLAAELYAVLGQTYHEGTVVRVEDECSNFAREGNALTITGGATEWTTMNALVQGVREDIGSGVTTLTVGVAPRLGAADMLDLLRRERKRREADEGRGLANAGSRGDGLP